MKQPATDTPSPEIPIGAPVVTADGQALGHVVSVTRHVLVVEAGRFCPRGYALLRAEVDSVAAGTVVLRRSWAALTQRRIGNGW